MFNPFVHFSKNIDLTIDILLANKNSGVIRSDKLFLQQQYHADYWRALLYHIIVIYFSLD